MSADPKQVKSVFLDAADQPAADRAAFLDKACRQDAELRKRVEHLLQAHDEGGDSLQRPDAAQGAGGVATRAVDPPEIASSDRSDLGPLDPEGPSTMIGPYKLLQEIGEGGMGTVYMAQQLKPVKRMVALKVIKPGMDSKAVLARFEAERQALALMDHPHIAKVLDSGTTDNGRPYFSMELVKGIKITKYCDEHQLSLRERLNLFLPVCQAIQHAHQKGIIHRDVKPSNVLVASYDGKPVPKVIDFGVAKAMGQQLTERTVFTAFGHIIGTMEYMSPEQAELNALDVDTRSDIYSLGVLLYELMTGTTPLSRKRLKQAAVTEALRLIREEEAQKPSTRLSASESLPALSAQRKSEPAKLTKMMRGELDWIVLKALEKDRSRRYETANAFARDIERFLHDEPVEACPASTGYRLRKFARKNRSAFRVAAAVFFLLVAGVIMSGWQAARAMHAEATATTERDRALRAEAETSVNEKKAKHAEQQAKASEKTARDKEAEALAVLTFFQENVLAAARPEKQAGGLGINATIRDALDAAEPKIAEAFRDNPLAEASIRNSIGLTYNRLGQEKLAVPQHERAVSLRKEILGLMHRDTLSSMVNLANDFRGSGRFKEALELDEELLKLRKATLGADHADTLTSMNNLALDYSYAGRSNDALRLREETFRLLMDTQGPNHSLTLLAMLNLAGSIHGAGRRDEALAMAEEALKLRLARFGPKHRDTLQSQSQVGGFYRVAGRLDKAVPLLEGTLQLQKDILGHGHPETLNTKQNLGLAYGDAGRSGEAIRLLEEVVNTRKVTLVPDHANTLGSMLNLGLAYRTAGMHLEAIALLEEVVTKRKATLSPDHANTLNASLNLGIAYRDAGRPDEAIGLLEEVVITRKATLGPDHANTLNAMFNLGIAYQVAGRSAHSIALHKEVLQLREARLGSDDPYTLGDMNNLAFAYVRAGQLADALPVYEVTVKRATAKLAPDHTTRLLAMNGLGETLVLLKKYTEAEPILRQCLEIRDKKQPGDWQTFRTKSVLGASLLGQKKYADAEPLLLQGYTGMKQREAKIVGANEPRLTEALQRLVELYETTGQQDNSAKWRKELEAANAKGKDSKK